MRLSGGEAELMGSEHLYSPDWRPGSRRGSRAGGSLRSGQAATVGLALLGALELEALALAVVLTLAVVIARLAVGPALEVIHAVAVNLRGALGESRTGDGCARQRDEGGRGGEADGGLRRGHGLS